MRQKQIVLGRLGGALDAEIAKGYLAAAGIDANILKDDGGRMFSSIQQRQGRHLVVAEVFAAIVASLMHLIKDADG